MRILLAEDNAIASKALAAGLASDGYEVELAYDGETALECARAHPPDFVISDVLMPKMDGYSLCRAIREDERLHTIPVIFYSATFLEPEDEELARAVGATGFIHKDSEPEVFHRRLRDILERSPGSGDVLSTFSRQNPETLTQQHQAALVTKLHKKVAELENEKRALRENQRFLDQIVRTIPDVVFALKMPEMEPSYIAPDAEYRLIGYSGDEVMGGAERWIALLHEDDRQRVVEELQQMMESRKSAVIVTRMCHKDGGFRWVESRVSPRLDEQGEVVEVVGSLTDITQRRDAEEGLRESEKRLNTLFRNLPGMAYRCENSRDWNMQFLSEGVETLTGYRRQEVENSAVISYAELIEPMDRERVWEEVQQALEEKRQFSVTYRIRHKDGSLRWVWERGVGVMDEDSPEPYLEGFINDITLRKRAEEKLIASEQRFRSLFEMMESGMALQEVVFDDSGKAIDYRFLDVNPAFERLLGLSAESIVGHTSRQVIPGMDPEWMREYLQVAQSGEAGRFLRYIKSLDRYFDVVAYQTQPNQFAMLVTDVSEQRRAEEQIRNLARFPEENPSPVLRIDSRGELTYSNPAGKLLLQYCSDTSGHSPCPAFVEAAAEALASGKLHRIEFATDERYYSFVIAPILESGYANLYGRDITKRVQASQQLERVNRVLRTLSKGNRSLVHASSERELLDQVCLLMVSEGGYPYVWAGYKDAEGRFTPQAHCGEGKPALDSWLQALSGMRIDESFIAEPLRGDHPAILSDLHELGGTVEQQQALGSSGFSVLLLLPLRLRGSEIGVIGMFSDSREKVDEVELELLHELAGDVAYGIQALRTQAAHEKGMQRIQSTMLQTIEAVSLTLEKRDPYTAGHQHRVVQLAMAIAHEMGMSEQRIHGLMLAALVHDIGKIHVPAEILNRPGRLSDTEFGIIKSHPQVGYEILKGVEFDWPIAEIILQHHERCDGSGYPQGLKRDQIILEARIIGVADVVEAITSHRPYRPGLGIEIALEEIQNGRDSRYDPVVVDACLKLFREKNFTWTENFNLFTTGQAGTVRPEAH